MQCQIKTFLLKLCCVCPFSRTIKNCLHSHVGRQFDIGSQSFVGDITIPLAKSTSTGEASHLLVFMIRGLSSNYKQIVGYEFTGNSTNAVSLKGKIVEIVEKVEEIGLRCNGLTGDMGPSNTAVWKLWGIKGNRGS